jgi:hypothetical protein
VREPVIRVLFVVCCGFLLCGCDKASGQAQREAKKTADALTGDAKGSAAANPACKLFTVAEMGKYISESVSAGVNAAGGTGCQWSLKADENKGWVIVQILPEDYHNWDYHRRDKQLPDVGIHGYVWHDGSTWEARAIKGDESIIVNVVGPSANESATVDLLKETMKRYKK